MKQMQLSWYFHVSNILIKYIFDISEGLVTAQRIANFLLTRIQNYAFLLSAYIEYRNFAHIHMPGLVVSLAPGWWALMLDILEYKNIPKF